MKHRSSLFFLTAALTLLTPVLHAHHSTAAFDTEQVITIEGIVTRVQWVNPHVYIYIDQTTENGEIVNWEIEGFGPASMRRMGWTRNTLNLGDSLTVSGNPPKNPGSHSIYPQTMQQGDNILFSGQAFFTLALSGGATPEISTNSLDGIWTTQLATSLIPFLSGTDLHDLTEAGAAAVAGWDEPTMNPAINCTQMASPFFMIIPDAKRITTNESVIMMTGDYDSAVRTIHMNVTSHDGASSSSQGHSIGRWEGDNLIIDTTHFAPHAMGNGSGVPSGSQKHLIERLTINDDGKSLSYYFELSDLEFLASPFTGDTDWTFSPDVEFITDECNLESARRFVEY